jgi:hypothetical protein
MGAFWQAVGWVGSALLVYSLMQQAVLRFRIWNLAASLSLLIFNVAIRVWPMVAVNAVITAINAWQIRRLLRTRDDESVFEVLELGTEDPYVRKFLSFYGKDIARFQPDFRRDHDDASGRRAYLVLRDAIPAGLVIVHDHGDGEAHVELDYVVPAERDFTPGQFVYRKSGLFADHGFTRLVATARNDVHRRYLERMGFMPEAERMVLHPA